MPVVKTALVTGADGFIGSALYSRLESMGVRVYRLSRNAMGPDTIAADLGRDPITALKDIRPEIVFHPAGRVHVMDERAEAEAEPMRVTVEGTRDVLQAAAYHWQWLAWPTLLVALAAFGVERFFAGRARGALELERS
jgi:nucleoside-diphosphate-sugar epimerase